VRTPKRISHVMIPVRDFILLYSMIEECEATLGARSGVRTKVADKHGVALPILTQNLATAANTVKKLKQEEN